MDEENLEALPPIFLMTAETRCWKCDRPMFASAFAARAVVQDGEMVGDTTTEDDMVMLTGIAELPEPLQRFLTACRSDYHFNDRVEYYANHCECGAFIGDHYLFSEPEGAFFPLTTEAAAAIQIDVLPIDEPIKMIASYGYGTGDFILQHAQRRKVEGA